MGGAAVAVLAAAAATRQNRAPLASLLTRVVRVLHDASVAAAAAEEDKAGAGSRRRRRRSSSSLLLGPDFLDTWDLPPRAASRTPPPQDGGADYGYTTTIIDGKSIAEDIRLHIAEEVRQMKSAVGHVPGLAVVLVGDRRDSESYVRYKTKGCEEVGIKSLLAKLPGNCIEDEVMDSVSRFNEDPSVHGILVQLPLPQHMDEERILSTISLEKDVDGFHPMNVGNLALRSRKPLFLPCAAKACIELLLQSGIELMRHHATVSVIHAFTTNPEAITRESDIVISAAGVANLVRGRWLKQGAVVIDVGTNPIEDPTSDYGYRLTGDVCFEEAVKLYEGCDVPYFSQ
ncbi:bifunctional protein FolD 2-like [Panicum miliaceum]|uniref:methenyltetrahydrofolate cyclohydrolase n=1 Tax=Panicum miliaceum TaxID=4540 RepID=A0A3L6QS76_PANMI|nr:bifunctional protein FolD 2-like [Panicum miliaceum]